MRKRTGLILALALSGALALTALASYGTAALGKNGDLKGKRMSGYLEVPSINSTGRGTIEVRINDNSTIEYRLTYSRLSSAASAAHIHFAQPSVNGGIVAFLCGGGDKPACPAGNTTTASSVTGTIDGPDILAIAAQGLAAGNIADAIAAIRAGFTYANVHTANFGGGEIRGQIRASRGNGNGGGDDD
jgi:CHRD domain